MSQTIEGAIKARDSNLKNNPNYFRDIDKIGGSRKVPKGFSTMDKQKARDASSKGGKISKRNHIKEPNKPLFLYVGKLSGLLRSLRG